MMSISRGWRYLWTAPTTAVGAPLLLAALVSGGGVEWVDGVLEVHGGLVDFYLRRVVGLVLKGGASAMTLGHIVVGRDRAALEATRAHERNLFYSRISGGIGISVDARAQGVSR
jgi:hypothetical protein